MKRCGNTRRYRMNIKPHLQYAARRGEELSGSRSRSMRPSAPLQAIFEFIGHEYRRERTVRAAALSLLADTLIVSGVDGEHYRAIIAPRIAFLRHVAPRCLDEHRDQLFGDSAPGNVGQATIDLALSRGLPDPWLLEHFRGQVRDAVQRGTGSALDHYLIAILWQVTRSSVDDAVTFLRSP